MTDNLVLYCLHLADNALVLGHRNSEWTGHGPVLEQDIALSNISLDLIGQSRNFYQLASSLKGDGTTEDDLAFMRSSSEYLNCLLVEQENGHWGKTIIRQFLFSSYVLPLYTSLEKHQHRQLAGICAKAVKEVVYHRRWSSEWMIRLGQGTEESHHKMHQGLTELWPYTAEMVTPVAFEERQQVHFTSVENEWRDYVFEILAQAALDPPSDVQMQHGGKQGLHTSALEDLLTEMQYMQRTYPGMKW